MLTFTIKRNWFEMIASGEKKRNTAQPMAIMTAG